MNINRLSHMIFLAITLSSVSAIEFIATMLKLEVNTITTVETDSCQRGSWQSSPVECAVTCVKTGCAGLAFTPPEADDHLCVHVSSRDELPRGLWTLYKRDGRR